jgi:hypothetical protein
LPTLGRPTIPALSMVGNLRATVDPPSRETGSKAGFVDAFPAFFATH